METMDAQGALDSFLGRLTTVLVEEAQLLGRVRGDVEFIKDEMESMNGLIIHLTEAQHRDHQVRAWMKQVVGLTRDCEGNVELYVHYVGSKPGDDDGLLGYLRQIARFLRTIPVRHRIATRIQELRVRAQDIGDRRQRYGVTVPESTRVDMNAVDVEPSMGEEDHGRRAVLLDAAQPPPDDEEVVRRSSESLVKWLSSEPAIEDEDGAHPRVSDFIVLGKELAEKVADQVYQYFSQATIFDCMAWSCNYYFYTGDVGTVLAEILKQVADVQLQPGQEDEVTNQAAGTKVVDENRVKQLISKIQRHLKDKRFLIVVVEAGYHYRRQLERYKVDWKRLHEALLQAADGCLPGSAIIMTTRYSDLALSSSRYKIIHARNPGFVRDGDGYEFYIQKATGLLKNEVPASAQKIKDMLRNIFNLCGPNTFAMKTFLHLLYVHPNRNEVELHEYQNTIVECKRLKRSISNQVLRWCYNELPSKYRSCLLYLAIFPEGHIIRTTSLARRWVAEGLITATDEIQSSTDEAEHYLDVLFIRGFVSPMEVSAEGNIKSCTVHRELREFIARVATDVNFMNSNLPPHLARYLSVHNRIGSLQNSHSNGDSKDIAAYLPSLAASPQWKLLKVLDLEGCHGLEKKHMKSICKILLLKYLSLRNTDVTELPKQIKELQCLETLDIRQTKVSDSNGTRTSGESFSSVELPLGIHKLQNMEILSRVKVTDSDSELTGIAQLLKLRKLGVALHGKSAKLNDLFCEIEKLSRCLRALSLLIHPLAGPADDEAGAGLEDDLPSLPQFIERLNISGISNGISRLVQEHHQLTKMTLSGTNLKDDDLRILGGLRELRCLRLQHNSYPDNVLVIKEHEFQSLKYLLVKGISSTKISIVKGAAPKLERIVLSFDRMGGLSGTEHLSELKELELNGDRILP